MTQRSRYSFDLFLPANSSHTEELAPQYGGGPGAVGYPGSVTSWEVNWSNIAPFNDLGPNAKFNCLITGTGYVLPRGLTGLDIQTYIGNCYPLALTMSGMDITSKPMETQYRHQLIAPMTLVSGQRTYQNGPGGAWTFNGDPIQTLQYKVEPFNLIVRNPTNFGKTTIYLTPLVQAVDTGDLLMDGDGGSTISYHLQFDLVSTE